jgi:hypothetical protein
VARIDIGDGPAQRAGRAIEETDDVRLVPVGVREMVLPSGLNATSYAPPPKLLRCSPVPGSKMSLPVARFVPSGLNAKELTTDSPLRVRTFLPVRALTR